MGVKLGSFSVFENRVLRRIFEPKGEELVGDWRRLHNEELHSLHTSTYIVKVTKSRGSAGRGM
jgi:hypothetical protein